jgi:hypothetical protein
LATRKPKKKKNLFVTLNYFLATLLNLARNKRLVPRVGISYSKYLGCLGKSNRHFHKIFPPKKSFALIFGEFFFGNLANAFTEKSFYNEKFVIF